MKRELPSALFSVAVENSAYIYETWILLAHNSLLSMFSWCLEICVPLLSSHFIHLVCVLHRILIMFVDETLMNPLFPLQIWNCSRDEGKCIQPLCCSFYEFFLSTFVHYAYA